MTHSMLKVVFCLTAGLILLLAPFLLDISPDGKAYAGSSKSNNRGVTGKVGDFHGYTSPGSEEPGPGNEEPGNNNRPPAPVPEPATMLLVGGGAIGLAALRRKFKKK